MMHNIENSALTIPYKTQLTDSMIWNDIVTPQQTAPVSRHCIDATSGSHHSSLAGRQHVFSSTSSSRYLYLCSTSLKICFPRLPSYDTWVIWYPMQTIISRPRLGLELGQTRCSVSLEWRQQKYRAFPAMDGRRRSLVSVRIGSARYRSREKKAA